MKKLADGLCIFLAAITAASAAQYRFIRRFRSEMKGDGTISASTRRRASNIVVVDLNDDRPIGEINDTPGLHGFALAPSRGFSSNGRENKLSLVDPKTLRTISKVVTGENPDAILYEPQRAEVYAFNGRRQSATIIEPKSRDRKRDNRTRRQTRIRCG